MLEEQTCLNLGQQRMSLSVLSDVEDDLFRRNWPLGKINFNQQPRKKHHKTIQVYTRDINESKIQEKVPLPLSIINSTVADKGLCKYPRGTSTVSKYCHRFVHQFFSQPSDEHPKILFL